MLQQAPFWLKHQKNFVPSTVCRLRCIIQVGLRSADQITSSLWPSPQHPSHQMISIKSSCYKNTILIQKKSHKKKGLHNFSLGSLQLALISFSYTIMVFSPSRLPKCEIFPPFNGCLLLLETPNHSPSLHLLIDWLGISWLVHEHKTFYSFANLLEST